MGTLIAVDGATLFQDDPLVVCTITPVGIPSITCKAEGKGMLKDGYNITVSAITYPSAGATIPDPAVYPAAFITGATKVKADDTLVLLEGDTTATISAAPLIPASPSPTPYPITFKIEITVAGQIKVKAI